MSTVQINAATTPPRAIVMSSAPLPTRSFAASSSLDAQVVRPIRPDSPSITDAKAAKTDDSLEERLFDNAAELKIALSEIAMHLSGEWRHIIFKQLDRLLDPASWEDDSSFIKKPPFLTFLRFVVYAAPTRFPSLGVSPKGHILAAWLCPPLQIAIEFLEGDKAAATFSIPTARSKEIIAWRGHVADLKDFIHRNGLSDCLGSKPV